MPPACSRMCSRVFLLLKAAARLWCVLCSRISTNTSSVDILSSYASNRYCFFYMFFFSSRRRHTRSKRDWSSDVCSSDLCATVVTGCQFATVSAVATVLAQHGSIDTFGFSFPLRFENAIVSYAIYLRQLIWPVDLAVLYPHPEKFVPFLTIAGCAALLVALSAIAIIYRKRFPFLFTGWFWFVGMLVPVMGIVQVGRQSHADRYTYLPLIGITIAIVWLVAELTARWRLQKQIGAIACTIITIALSACAYHQTTFWRNADSLWPHTLAVTTNNDGAHLAFATSLFAEGKTEEAIAHARAAAEIRPTNAGVYGEVPAGLEGKTLDEAILFWSARVEDEPNNIGARNTFGVLLVQKHQTRAAIQQWESVLALNQNDGNAQSNLAWVFATTPDGSLRNGTRAVELAEHALKLAGGISPILQRTLA